MSGVGPIGGGGFGGGGGLADILALRQQIIARSQLLQAVHAAPAAAGSATVYAPVSPGGTTAAPGGFGGALENALGAVNASQSRADALTTGYEKGEVTDVAKVMLSRQEASVGFEATLQVRNKLLSAYQDIMKLGM